MPSEKKRINLTVPDEVYEQIQLYKRENGIENDASACLQLIVLQLKAQKNSKAIFAMMQNFTLEQIQELSMDGTKALKEFADMNEPPAFE